MPDNVKRTLVQLDYDQAAGKRVENGAKAVKSHLEAIRAEIRSAKRDFGISTASMGDYGSEAQRVTRRGDELRAALRGVREEVKKTDGVFAQAKAARQYEEDLRNAGQQAQAYGRVEGGVRGISSVAGTVGGSGFQSRINVGADFINAAQGVQTLKAELPKLAAELGTSTAALGALGVGLVVLNVAVGKLKDSIGKTGDVTRNFIDANQKYAEIIATGTTEEVRAAIQAEEDRQRALRIERETLASFLAQVHDVDGLAGAFLDLSDALGANYGGVEDVKNRLKDLDGELSSSESVQTRLIQALQKGLTIGNDAAAAEEALAKERERAYQATLDLIDKQVADITALRRGVESATVEQVDAQIAEFQRRVQSEYDRQTLLSQKLDEGTITQEEYEAAIKSSNDEVKRLRFLIADWNTYVRDAAEARERENRALALGKSGLEALAKAHEEAAAAAEKYAETLAKRELQLLQDAEKFALDRTRKLADHYADMAEMDADYYRDRGDILRDMRGDLADTDQERLDELEDLNDDLEVLALDHADAMRQIERDASRDIQMAAARFDAWGIYQAQQNRRDALEDEQNQYNKEKTERDEQFDDRIEALDRERDATLKAADQALRDLEDKHRREKAANERAFAEELRREDEDRRIKLRHQKEQWDLEDQQQQTHYATQSGKTITHYANMEGMADTHFHIIETKFAASMTRMAATAAQQPSSAAISAAQGAVGSILSVLGGNVPAIASANTKRGSAPEIAQLITPARAGNAVGGRGPVQIDNINIDVPAVAGGVSAQDIAQAVQDKLFDVFAAIG